MDAEVDAAKRLAISLLNHKMYTGSDMSTKLIRLGYARTVIEKAMEFLIDTGYIDDAKYTEMFILECVDIKRWGEYRIRHKLLARGVDRYLVEDKLRKAEIDSDRNIRYLVTAKLRGRERVSPVEAKKIVAHLMYKGFGIEDINRVMEEMDIIET